MFDKGTLQLYKKQMMLLYSINSQVLYFCFFKRHCFFFGQISLSMFSYKLNVQEKRNNF